MRNGYEPITVKTTSGPVAMARPKLRGTTEAFASRLLGAGVSKSNALESLCIAGFVRGLSVRDVEAMLAEALGAQAALSKSTVSRICQAIAAEFDAWRGRKLDLLSLDYLFLDASHFRMHPGSPATPILVAWGITTEGKPVLVALEAAANEGTDAWDGFVDSLADRGLRAPLMVISDGAAGLVSAIERNYGHSLRQRCLIHRCRNLLAKVPRNAQDEVKIAYWKLFDVPALPARRPHRVDRPSAIPTRALAPHPPLQPDRAHLRRDPPTRQGHRPVPRRDQLRVPGVGGARPGLGRLARPDHDPPGHQAATGPTPPAARPPHCIWPATPAT
jgi:transposase-like protein